METKNIKKQLVKILLNQEINSDNENELINMLIDNTYAIDVDKEEDKKRTKGDILADKLTKVAGSWKFIISFSLFLLFWLLLNIILNGNAIDPYPFILLNLLLSCLAALQAPIIMMSQNRQAKKDSMRNQNDYIIDLKSELILEVLYEKINLVLERQKEIENKIKK